MLMKSKYKVRSINKVDVVFFMSVLGLVLANVYSWTMTTTGLRVTQYLPENSVIPDGYVAGSIGFLIQIAIFVVYFVIPNLKLKSFFLFSIVLPFFFVLIFISVTFSVVSITQNSYGDQLFMQREAEIKRLIDESVVIERSYTDIYSDYVVALERLARDSENGRDSSNIARCGPKCRGYWNKREIIVKKYGLLFESTRLNDYVIDKIYSISLLKSIVSILVNRNKQFVIFLKDADITTAESSSAVENIKRELDLLENETLVTNAEKKDLSMAVFFAQLEHVISSKSVSGEFALRVTIALLPDIVSLIFTIVLYFVAKNIINKNQIVENIINDVKNQRKINEKLQEYYGLKTMQNAIHELDDNYNKKTKK